MSSGVALQILSLVAFWKGHHLHFLLLLLCLPFNLPASLFFSSPPSLSRHKIEALWCERVKLDRGKSVANVSCPPVGHDKESKCLICLRPTKIPLPAPLILNETEKAIAAHSEMQFITVSPCLMASSGLRPQGLLCQPPNEWATLCRDTRQRTVA